MFEIEHGKRYISRDGKIRVAIAAPECWSIYSTDGEFICKCTVQGKRSNNHNSPEDLVELCTPDYAVPNALTEAVKQLTVITNQITKLEDAYFKPVWESAPTWAKWLAMDCNGQWYWFEHKPSRSVAVWSYTDGISHSHEFMVLPYKVKNWKKSRQKRPAEVN